MLKTNIFNDWRKEKKRNQLCGVKYLASGGSGYMADRGTPTLSFFWEEQENKLFLNDMQSFNWKAV